MNESMLKMTGMLDLKFFRLPAPVKLRTPLGVYEINHRVGRLGGSYTRERLTEFLFGRHLQEFLGNAEKKHPAGFKTGFKKALLDHERYRCSLKISHIVKRYGREKLRLEYEPQGLLPVMRFCDIGQKHHEVWIQGFIDKKTSKLAIGKPEEVILAFGL